MSFNNGIVGTPRVALICRNKSTQLISGWTTLTNWFIVQDPTNEFVGSTGIFTAPRAGVYNFTLGNGLSQPIGAYIGLSILKNGTQLYNDLISTSSSVTQYRSMSGCLELAAGDTISPRSYCQNAANDTPSVSNTWFTITERITNF
jgi:C1q domain